MKEMRNAPPHAITDCSTDFIRALEKSYAIFGERTFRTKQKEDKWKLSVPMFDAVMVAIDRLRVGAISQTKIQRINRTLEALLENKSQYDTLIGKPNTAAAIKSRIDIVARIIRDAI